MYHQVAYLLSSGSLSFKELQSDMSGACEIVDTVYFTYACTLSGSCTAPCHEIVDDFLDHFSCTVLNDYVWLVIGT